MIKKRVSRTFWIAVKDSHNVSDPDEQCILSILRSVKFQCRELQCRNGNKTDHSGWQGYHGCRQRTFCCRG